MLRRGVFFYSPICSVINYNPVYNFQQTCLLHRDKTMNEKKSQGFALKAVCALNGVGLACVLFETIIHFGLSHELSLLVF